jgi:hypothetical protein
LEAQVSWGAEAAEALQPLQICVSQLVSAIRRHLRRLLTHKEMQPVRPELEIILYVTDDPQDSFSHEVSEAVEKAEAFLQRHLKI